ncbi:hypothetical protein HY571_01875 [Candidatus Micrarchaeota archaeon]|nr:hypothetical protein [Candidatus Micrarchaeota archaeon]
MNREVVLLVIGAALGFAFSLLFWPPISFPVDAAVVRPLFSPGTEGNFVNLVRSAGNSIDVEMYVFTSTVLKEELANAVSRGVSVRVLLDESISTNFETAEELRGAGVAVRFASRRFERTHSKFFVVDDEVVVVGSNNWTFHSLNLNREASVVIKNREVAREFVNVFESDWLGGTAT